MHRRFTGSIRPLLMAAIMAGGLIAASAASAGETQVTAPAGVRIHNVASAFIAYGEQGAALDPAGRAELWDRMLAARWPDFFNQVIYRNQQGPRRQAYRAALIARFWAEVAPRLAGLKAMNQTADQRLLKGLEGFQRVFPGFQPAGDYYLTVSFSFDGKVTEVNGKTVLALGLERFGAGDPRFDITVAHELFHLYHFATFRASGGLYRGVWSEGLAVYASAALVPGHRKSAYLGFSGQRMNQIHDNYRRIVAFIRANYNSGDHAVKRACLGMEDNALGIPPGAGYYIGMDVVAALLKQGATLPEMARWNADTAHRRMAAVLAQLEGK